MAALGDNKRSAESNDGEKGVEGQEGLYTLCLAWNGGRKMEFEGAHWGLEAANAEAKAYWDEFNPEEMDMTDVTCDKPGEPYCGFSCLGYGSSSLLITVVDVRPHGVSNLKYSHIKQALKAKGLPSNGKKTEVVAALQHYLESIQDNEQATKKSRTE